MAGFWVALWRNSRVEIFFSRRVRQRKDCLKMYNGRWMYSSWGFYDGVENVSFFSLFYEWNSGIVFNMFSVGFYFLSFLREVRKKGRFKRWKFWKSWFSFFHFLRYLIRVLCIIKFFHERYFCNWEYDSTGKCWRKKKTK